MPRKDIRLATPALCSCSELPETYRCAIDSLLALGHTSGADTLLGFGLANNYYKENHENTGCGSWGNALLQRGEALTAENQYRNIPVLYPRWRAWPVLIGWRLFTQRATGGAAGVTESGVERGRTYPLDVLVAESQGMIGYMLARA